MMANMACTSKMESDVIINPLSEKLPARMVGRPSGQAVLCWNHKRLMGMCSKGTLNGHCKRGGHFYNGGEMVRHGSNDQK